jgi:hypothetical protein
MKWYTVKVLSFAVCVVLASLGMITALVLSPAHVDGYEMPGTIVIKYLQDQYGPVTFDHEMHAAMAGDCGTCHHQHNEKIRASCVECHVLKASEIQGFTACSACHSDYIPDMPEMPGLKVALHKTCFQCHVGMGDLGSSPGACVKMCHAKI